MTRTRRCRARRVLRLAGGALVCVAVGACGLFTPWPSWVKTPEGVDWSPFYGCYQAAYLRAEPGRRPHGWYFALDPVKPDSSSWAGGGPFGGLRARSADESSDEDSWWRPLAADRIQFYTGNPFGSRVIEFTSRGDSLVGRAFTATDVGGRESFGVNARRVSCSGLGFPQHGRGER